MDFVEIVRFGKKGNFNLELFKNMRAFGKIL